MRSNKPFKIILAVFSGLALLKLLFFLLFILLVAWGSDHLTQNQIAALAEENKEKIVDCIQAGNADRLKDWKGIKDVWTLDNGCIVFYCGGEGFGPATSYYGFYYSPDDTPFDIEAMTGGDPLVEEGNGWGWHECQNSRKGDNAYYTERICPCFFYYESHF